MGKNVTNMENKPAIPNSAYTFEIGIRNEIDREFKNLEVVSQKIHQASKSDVTINSILFQPVLVAIN